MRIVAVCRLLPYFEQKTFWQVSFKSMLRMGLQSLVISGEVEVAGSTTH